MGIVAKSETKGSKTTNSENISTKVEPRAKMKSGWGLGMHWDCEWWWAGFRGSFQRARSQRFDHTTSINHSLTFIVCLSSLFLSFSAL